MKKIDVSLGLYIRIVAEKIHNTSIHVHVRSKIKSYIYCFYIMLWLQETEDSPVNLH